MTRGAPKCSLDKDNEKIGTFAATNLFLYKGQKHKTEVR